MAVLSNSREAWIRRQVMLYTEQTLDRSPVIRGDTSNYMSIERGQIINLQGQLYLVRCNEREGRFTLDDQPKFWVKRAIALNDGKTYILKLVFHEDFSIRIGLLSIKCTRSEDKEAQVLEAVRDDERFMQGRTARDSQGNLVRIIDYIRGTDLLSHLYGLEMSHESYFHEHFPSIGAKVLEALRAIQDLHDKGFCHGDIRNDHLLIEEGSGRLRWIDFDLTQAFTDFDVWSVGNILHCVCAKGFLTFHEVQRSQPELKGNLDEDDASAFFPHRIMNQRKVFPYLPAKLNDLLMRFSMGTEIFYDSVAQIADDWGDCLADLTQAAGD